MTGLQRLGRVLCFFLNGSKRGVNLKCPGMLVGKKDFNIFKMKGFFFCVVNVCILVSTGAYHVN